MSNPVDYLLIRSRTQALKLLLERANNPQPAQSWWSVILGILRGRMVTR